MNEPRPSDLAACREILRAGSKGFAAASSLLPARVRASATVLYAFCRVADDAIDLDPRATEASVDALRERLERVHANRPVDDPVDRALAVVVANEKIPIALPRALLEGLAWDATGRRYETLDELHAYAARVAGSVGAMMTLVMGSRDPHVLARACELGVAMQLTNVARDVGEDARRGRVYLPLSWLREEHIELDRWLREPSATPSMRKLTARLLDAAGVSYRRADAGISRLPGDCRVAIRAARRIYSELGRVIEKNGFDSIGRRAVVSPARRVRLVCSSFVARTETGAIDAPPLEATRFLVDACRETS